MNADQSENCDFLARKFGLNFHPERRPELGRRLLSAAETLEITPANRLDLKSLTTAQLKTALGVLTVGETYFLRDSESFQLLQKDILPSIVARRSAGKRFLRFWSAGCSTGEEAYSLAISCLRAIPNIEDWNIRILGTDIDTNRLILARAGVYSSWSFRGVPDSVLRRFFEKASNSCFVVKDKVKGLVTFRPLNLAVDPYPSPETPAKSMDLIFCRNVLMYLTKSHQKRTIEGLYRCLADDGLLLINPVEHSQDIAESFIAVPGGGGGVLQKKVATAPLKIEIPLSGKKPTAPECRVSKTEPIDQVAPDSPTNFVRIRKLADQGKLEKALSLCQLATSGSTDPEAHFLHGTICQEIGKLDEALVEIKKALFLEPDFVLAHYVLGIIYKQQNRTDKAKQHFEIALKLLSVKNQNECTKASEGLTHGQMTETIRNLLAGSPE